ncbi:MAG: phosphate signaling complex protein PhoU [Alphaproteobacteria bacterium]|nr:phosphate signaling complex protein PhoU [Alphaproteobacteria bacterium]
MPGTHIVRSYDEQLRRLGDAITTMGGLAEAQLASAVTAVGSRDSVLAERVVAGDAAIDALEAEALHLATQVLALRQPVAVDLRLIVASFKLSSEIERIGDYARNIAKRALVLNQGEPLRAAQAVPRMGQLVARMLRDVLDAFVARDAARARDVWRRDEEVDALYNSVFRELLTYMMEDARSITPCTHLLFIAKNLERIGDHATNMAETVIYLIEGQMPGGERPKGDFTAAVEPPSAGGSGQ